MLAHTVTRACRLRVEVMFQLKEESNNSHSEFRRPCFAL